MKRPLALAVLAAACSSSPRYLGSQLPTACERGDIEPCAGWLAERDLVAGQIDAYDDPRLRAYVQRIADRLARGTILHRAPRVIIGDHDGTYAAFGERIVIGRMAIERLGSEAELAAIVAHELVHVEGRHAALALTGASETSEPDPAWLAGRRDAEAIADERAVTLLARAGYSPHAMERALAAVLDVDDDEHPPRVARLAAVRTLASGLPAGADGRSELLAHIDGMVVGRNTRLGMRVGDAWVIASLAIALDLPARHTIRIDGDALIMRRGRSVMTAYPIGRAWARELAADLEDAATADSALGKVTVGIAREPQPASTPIAKLQRAVRDLLPQPTAGTQVIVLVRPRGGLVIELSASTEPALRDRWLAGLRRATRRELRAAEPARIELHVAPRTATVGELVEDCPDPAAARQLDDPQRIIERGERFKCSRE